MIQMRSFIFNSKKVWIKCIVTIGAFWFCCGLLNYMYEDYNFNNWTIRLWEDYYSCKENIDNLFIGSSHVYCSLNPAILDELNGKNNYNMASNSQKLNGSYYVLREVDKKQKLEHVYLETFYLLSTGADGEYKNADVLYFDWHNSDCMKPSLNRLEYKLTMSRPENYPETFLNFLRYRDRLFDVDYVIEQIKCKNSEEYLTRTMNGHYRDKGYYYSEDETQPDRLYTQDVTILDEEPLTQDAEKYLRKIIEYCQKNGMEITLYSAPFHELLHYSTQNYGAYIQQISDIADEYGIEYYDFNLCKSEYLDLQSLDNYKDLGHLNVKGAEKFTKLFAEVMQNNVQDNQKYFYSSIEEKYEEFGEKVYGISSVSYDADLWKMEIESSMPEDTEYRIVLETEEGSRMVQEFSTNKTFFVPKEETGTCFIIIRKTNEAQTESLMEIKY